MRYSVTQIDFFNPGKCPDVHFSVYGAVYNDETEFDTHNEEELAQLWWEFCKENDLISVYKTHKKEE